jgi:hypothetical protein
MRSLTLAFLLSLAACGAPFTTSADPASASSSGDAGVDAPLVDELPDGARPPAADVLEHDAQVQALVDAGDAGELLEPRDAGDAQAAADGSLRLDTGLPDAGIDAPPPDAPMPSCEPSACAACGLGASPCCTGLGCGCYQFGVCR